MLFPITQPPPVTTDPEGQVVVNWVISLGLAFCCVKVCSLVPPELNKQVAVIVRVLANGRLFVANMRQPFSFFMECHTRTPIGCKKPPETTTVPEGQFTVLFSVVFGWMVICSLIC